MLVSSVYINFTEDEILRTLADHPCDLCGEVIAEQTKCHKVTACIAGERFGAWQHQACWDGFMASGNPIGRIQYDLFKHLRGEGLL